MKKKRGRPPGTTKSARDKLVQLRVDAREIQGFMDAANLSGLSVSAWARERLRKTCREELEQAKMVVPFIGNG